MKIKKLIPSENLKANGLIFKEMKNLKQVVALFGKNGSGKSRLLSHLPNEFFEKINLINGINRELNELTEYSKKMSLNVAQEHHIDDLKERRERLLVDIDFQEGDSFIVINSRGTNIQQPESMMEHEYRPGSLNLIDNPNFQIVKQNCAKFIKALCKSDTALEYHRRVEGKSYYQTQEELQKKNIRLFNLLKEVVFAVMSKKLDYSVDEYLTPIVTLNKRKLSVDELSDGEKELLAYCTFLVLQQQEDILNQSLSLKNKVLVIDELELFLHPKAQIDLIKGLRSLVGNNGQIWLATHSLAILSILDRDEIWLMEDGNIISPSIDTPNKVLESLIGEGNIDSLENFLSSQYEWAAIQFALESLFPPKVSPYNSGDVQQTQVKERLLSLTIPTKVLDFGAGKGRIAEEIIRNPELASNIYYQPLEVNGIYRPQLKELTSKLQSLSNVSLEVEREVLDDYEKLNESKYTNFFDCIFLINVLHEVPINKWASMLTTLLNALTDSGRLLILEDQSIPRGENAHEYGFIIFDIEEFQILFSRPSSPKTYKHKDPKYAERLTCLEIPKIGSSVSSKSIKEALMRKKTNCKAAIKRLRGENNKSAKHGRLNGFLTQLYANVDMAMHDYI